MKVAQGRVVNGTVVTETHLPEGARVAIVLDGETFVGLITRTDLINHLSLNR